jgi:ribosomal-protein-serine acetyltransferase
LLLYKLMSESLYSQLPFEALEIDNAMQLRPLAPEEARELFQLIRENREHLGRWLPWVDDTQSPNDSYNFLKSTAEARLQGREYGYGIIINQQIVGYISLIHIDSPEPRIGYWIKQELAGHGITTKAVVALTQLGTTHLGLKKIIIRSDPDNIASNRVAAKAGYYLTRVDSGEDGAFNIWSVDKT